MARNGPHLMASLQSYYFVITLRFNPHPSPLIPPHLVTPALAPQGHATRDVAAPGNYLLPRSLGGFLFCFVVVRVGGGEGGRGGFDDLMRCCGRGEGEYDEMRERGEGGDVGGGGSAIICYH